MYDDFEVNPIIKKMRAYSDSDDVWTDFKVAFAKKSPETRIDDLQRADAWLEEEGTRPTRETASIIQAKRELMDIHWMLREAGR